MNIPNHIIKLNNLLYLFGVMILYSCVDAVEPEFDFEEGLVYIEAFAATDTGASYVSITESAVIDGDYENVFVSGANVSFQNIENGDIVQLIEEGERYFPDANFVVVPGQSWQMQVEFPDGRRYLSDVETVLDPVEINAINATYNPELLFSDAEGTFVPGHFISVDFDDPVNETNYYFWNFESFEKALFCERCEGGIFREGQCQPNPPNVRRKAFYDYRCDGDCWDIQTSASINIFSDEFVNGNTVSNLPVGNIILFSKEDILVNLWQFSISKSAYDYYLILNDLVDNNGSINAPPPAALLGNLSNPDDPDEFVLGRFTAASFSEATIFVDRTDIRENALERRGFIQVEACFEVCPPEGCPPSPRPGTCVPVTNITCEEGRFRTAVAPPGWVEQE